jgi:hypothetical protein
MIQHTENAQFTLSFGALMYTVYTLYTISILGLDLRICPEFTVFMYFIHVEEKNW